MTALMLALMPVEIVIHADRMTHCPTIERRIPLSVNQVKQSTANGQRTNDGLRTNQANNTDRRRPLAIHPIVVVSHDRTFIERFGDDTLTLADGQFTLRPVADYLADDRQ